MTQANPRLVEGTFMDKTKAVGSVIPKTLTGTIQEADHVATRIK